MKIFFDTEFIDDGKTIDLISIGMIKENGETYYAEHVNCHWENADDWVKKNVFSELDPSGESMKNRSKIVEEILEFVGDEKPEFWADYGAYDWIVLCQLFGKMIDLPDNWPYYCMDIQQLKQELKCPELPKQMFRQHNALCDSMHVKTCYEFLMMELRNLHAKVLPRKE